MFCICANFFFSVPSLKYVVIDQNTHVHQFNRIDSKNKSVHFSQFSIDKTVNNACAEMTISSVNDTEESFRTEPKQQIRPL